MPYLSGSIVTPTLSPQTVTLRITSLINTGSLFARLASTQSLINGEYSFHVEKGKYHFDYLISDSWVSLGIGQIWDETTSSIQNIVD